MNMSGNGTADGSAGDIKGGELVGGYAGRRLVEESRGHSGDRWTGRTAAARVATVLAWLLVWFAIVAPRLWDTMPMLRCPFAFTKSTASWNRSRASGYSGM